jgi:hypothetical protein
MPQIVLEKNHPTKSLVGASLDIGRVLADRDGVTFRAEGTCMYPAIRPGDVLRIQSRAVTDVSLGDVVVCRRPTHLFCHRVVARGTEEGRAYIVTRQDRTPDESDGPTFDENLLGVVVTIVRGGKPVSFQTASLSWPLRLYFALRLKLIELRLRVILAWQELLPKAQANAFYRGMMRIWITLAHPQISYRVRLPMPALGDAVYRQLSPETFSVQKDWRGRPVQRWTLLVHLNGSRKPAAWMTLPRDASGQWLVDESFVSARYRGAGLDAALQSKACAMLQRDYPEKEEDMSLLRTSQASLK